MGADIRLAVVDKNLRVKNSKNDIDGLIKTSTTGFIEVDAAHGSTLVNISHIATVVEAEYKERSREAHFS